MSKTPTKHYENAPQKIDIIEQWNKKTPKLSEIKDYTDKVAEWKNKDFWKLSEQYKELLRVENFMLTNQEIPVYEKWFSMDKIWVILYVMEQQKNVQQIFVDNVIENPYIPEDEKQKLLKDYNEEQGNLFEKYWNWY